ncbi:hypothetical protein C8J56DRAFT_1052574 [Mycena floridula]|nr:hypothetical protein C8J56DRAFT_1052574 [Mycena floridula]
METELLLKEPGQLCMTEKGESKLAPRLIKGKLVSYQGHCGYWIYIPGQHTIILSQDVIFEEGVSGEWSLPKAPTVCEAPPILFGKDNKKTNPKFIPDEFTDVNGEGSEPEPNSPDIAPDDNLDIPDFPVNAAEPPAAVEQEFAGEVLLNRMQTGPGWTMPVNQRLPTVYNDQPQVRRTGRALVPTSCHGGHDASEFFTQCDKFNQSQGNNQKPWADFVFAMLGTDPWGFLSFNDDNYVPQS